MRSGTIYDNRFLFTGPPLRLPGCVGCSPERLAFDFADTDGDGRVSEAEMTTDVQIAT